MPSGDHVGDVSVSGWFCTRRWSLPSAFMTQMSKSPSRLLEKAIRVPSGDQLGSWLKPPAKVSRFTSPPSACMEKIALVLLSTARVNAMRPFSPGYAPHAAGPAGTRTSRGGHDRAPHHRPARLPSFTGRTVPPAARRRNRRAPRADRRARPIRALGWRPWNSAPSAARAGSVGVVGLGAWQLGGDWGTVTEDDALGGARTPPWTRA